MALFLPYVSWIVGVGICVASPSLSVAGAGVSQACTADDTARWQQHQTCIVARSDVCIGNAYFLFPMGLMDSATAGAIISQNEFVDWDGDGDLDKLVVSGSSLQYYERVEGGVLLELNISSTSLSTRTTQHLHLVPGSQLLGYDWDGDTDADLLIGEPNGKIRYYHRSFSGQLHERAGQENPFGLIDVGRDATPYVADIDGDGVMDLIVKNGTDKYFGFHNSLSPHLLTMTNPVLSWQFKQGASPFVVDWHGIGEMATLLGLVDGTVAFLDLTPNDSTGGLDISSDPETNPFKDIQVDSYARPAVHDWDGDGLLDVLIGDAGGRIHFYQRQGGVPAGDVVQVPDAQNPFHNLATHVHSAPQVLDVDGDGDLDLITGARNDEILVFLRETNGDLQTTPTSGFFPGVAAGDSASFSHVAIVDWNHDGMHDVLVVNSTDSILWGRLDAAADFMIIAKDIVPAGIGLPDLIGMHPFDVDGDGDMDIATGWSTGYLRFLMHGRCTVPYSCSLKGSCSTVSEQCECHSGYEGFDCSLCAPGYFSHIPKTLPQLWECKACPTAVIDDLRDGVCNSKGFCDDDRKALHNAIMSGTSNSSQMFAVGSGTCSCEEPFSGDGCDEGYCPAGFEMVTVAAPMTSQQAVDHCRPCPAGKHKMDEGNHACRSCADGLPAANNGTGCACPRGTYFLGLFDNFEARCVACDEDKNHVTCAGGTEPPVAEKGYYLITVDTAIHCTVMYENGSACKGGSWFDSDELQCEPGHTGPLCGACKPMYARDKGGDQCVSCDTVLDTPFLYMLLSLQLLLMSSWAIFLTKRATASIMLMRTDAIMFRILNQWVAVNSVLAVLDFQEIDDVFSVYPFGGGSDSRLSTQAASRWLQSLWPWFTFGANILRLFKSQLFVECIMERRFRDQPVPDTQIRTLVAPLIWWNLYPVFMGGCLALQLLLFVKFSWPMSVRNMPTIGQAAVRRVLQAYGVTMEDAQKAVEDKFKTEDLIDFMKDPTRVMENPEEINIKLGRAFLCQVTANKVREHIIMKLKHLDDPTREDERAKKKSDPAIKNHNVSSHRRFDPFESEEFVKLLRSLQPLADDLGRHQLLTIYEIFKDPEGYLTHMHLGELMGHPDLTQRSEASGVVAAKETTKKGAPVAKETKTTGYVRKHNELDTVMFSGHHARHGVVLGLYGDISAKTVFIRSLPVFLIAMYNATDLTTERFYQTLHARSVTYPNGTQEFLWMSDTRIKIFSETHMQAFHYGARGWIVYCFGFTAIVLVVLFTMSRLGKLQTHLSLRNFGYFYNGMEPRRYYWELCVKRFDVLSVQAIAYTTICAHARSKLFMYSLLSVMFLSAHYLYRPFDDRQGKLLDRLEGEGLQTRFFSFQLLQIAVLFGTVEILPSIIVIIILAANAYFITFVFACIAVELASSFQSNVELMSSNLPRCLGRLLEEAFRIFCFVGNEREDLERCVQRFVWMGAGRPIQIIHHATQNQRQLSFPRRVFRYFLVEVYKLGSKNQREFAAALVGQTLDHMLTTVKCQQLSSHTFDFIFTLPVALRRLQLRGLAMHDIHPRQVKEELYEIFLEVEYRVAENPRVTANQGDILKVRYFDEGGRGVFEEFGSTTRDLGQALLYLYRLKSHQVLLLMLQAFRPFQPDYVFTPRDGEAKGRTLKSYSTRTSASALKIMSAIDEDSDVDNDSDDIRMGTPRGGSGPADLTTDFGKLKLLRAELQLLRTELCVAKKRVRDKKDEFSMLESDNHALREATQRTFTVTKEQAWKEQYETSMLRTESEMKRDQELSSDDEAAFKSPATVLKDPKLPRNDPHALAARGIQAHAPAPTMQGASCGSFWRTSLTQVPQHHHGKGLIGQSTAR